MARIRTIKPEFWQNESLSKVSLHSKLLAIALLNHSDDEGYFMANAALVRAACFPFDDTSTNVLRSLDELSSIGYIEVKTCGEKRIGYVVKFGCHQRIDRPQESKLKPVFIESISDSTNARRGLDEDSHQEQGTGKGKEQGKEHGKGTVDSAIGVSVSRRKVKVEKPDEVTQQHWDDWLAIRKKKPTQTAMDALYREAALAGISIGEAVKIAAERSWQGFKAEWLEAEQNGSGRYGKKPIDLDTFIIK